MMDFAEFDRRPIIVAVAGSNGAGKTTFYNAHLKTSGLPFINSDVLARDYSFDPYVAADVSKVLRNEFVTRKESFVFETVFSDPVGDKIAFLKESANSGYLVVLCFIGIPGPEISEQRVAIRVSQGGHDVPIDKLRSRFPRTIANLGKAIRVPPHVLIYDNGDLNTPFRQVASIENGQLLYSAADMPAWLTPLIP